MFLPAAIGLCETGKLEVLSTLFGSLTICLRAPKTATKRVFLITDEDNPHSGPVRERFVTSARTTLVVSIQTWTLKRALQR